MEATKRQSGRAMGGRVARVAVARGTSGIARRGVVLLEVIVALAILILGMAAVGMQMNIGLRIAGDSQTATRAVMLAETTMARLDAGDIQFVPNDEIEEDFKEYPGWAYRLYIDPTDTPDFNMVTLQILYKPGVAFEETPDFESMDVVHTSYTLRATPARLDLQRDAGLTQEQLQQATDEVQLPGFDPTNIDPTILASLDAQMLQELLPQLMKLLGPYASLLNSLPQGVRKQIEQAMQQAGEGKRDGARGEEDEGQDGEGSRGGRGDVEGDGGLPAPGGFAGDPGGGPRDRRGRDGQGVGRGREPFAPGNAGPDRGGRDRGGNRSDRDGFPGPGEADNGRRPDRNRDPRSDSPREDRPDRRPDRTRFDRNPDRNADGGGNRFDRPDRGRDSRTGPPRVDEQGGGNVNRPGSVRSGRGGNALRPPQVDGQGGSNRSGPPRTAGGPRAGNQRLPSRDGLSDPFRVPTEQDLYNATGGRSGGGRGGTGGMRR